MKKIQDVKI